MQNNYHAWEINPEDFPKQKSVEEQLRFLVGFAILAPSSHNSQPWEFAIGTNKIIVRPNFSRSLPASDANHRQLFISIGCAVQNLLVAADYYGFSTAISYNETITISFNFTEQDILGRAEHLIFSIPKRHTNRNPYQDKTPDDKFIKWVQNLATNNLEIKLITNQDQKSKIADVMLAAGITAMNNREFREELSHYIKSNITQEKTGMPGFGFGIPMPISLLASFMMKYINMNKITKRQDEKLLKEQTPIFIVISTREDNQETWIRVGQTYERIALEAERHNIKTAPMAAGIQIDSFYEDLQKILNTSYRPQVFFRTGYTEKITLHSPRLNGDEVT